MFLALPVSPPIKLISAGSERADTLVWTSKLSIEEVLNLPSISLCAEIAAMSSLVETSSPILVDSVITGGSTPNRSKCFSRSSILI